MMLKKRKDRLVGAAGSWHGTGFSGKTLTNSARGKGKDDLNATKWQSARTPEPPFQKKEEQIQQSEITES